MASYNWLLALFSAFITLFAISSASALPHFPSQQSNSTKWGTIWATAPQLVEPANLPPPPFNSSTTIFANSTIRQTIQVSLSAPEIRLRLSNAFGLAALEIDEVTIALPGNGSAGVDSAKLQGMTSLTFSGSSSVTIPKGSLAVSDPIKFPVAVSQVLTITLYLGSGIDTGAVTGHPGSRTDTWLSLGNYVADLDSGSADLQSVAHWYFISGLEGLLPTTSKTLSIVGDSITDGRGSDTDENDRWPDLVFAKLQKTPSTSHISIANQGLGGNCVLSECLGPNALSRIDRDVLAQSSIGYAMVFEGVNDIGTDLSTGNTSTVANDLIAGYQQIITRVHAAGIPVFGATITPFGGNVYDTPLHEESRQTVNDWIRQSVNSTDVGFDAIVDFDLILRDPTNVTRLNPKYNSGDGLHPNTTGYQALADAFPLEIFLNY